MSAEQRDAFKKKNWTDECLHKKSSKAATKSGLNFCSGLSWELRASVISAGEVEADGFL